MTLKTRRILFFISLLIFLIISPSIVLYSLGYKLNLENFKLEKTGGIFVNINYENYQIIIDNSIKKQVSKPLFTQKGLLIPNLIPKSYNIKIAKNGYKNWEKNLKVNSGIVTEVKNIFLIPEKPPLQEIGDKVSDFIFSKSKKDIAYIQNDTLTFLNIKDKKKIKIKLPVNFQKQNFKIINNSFNENLIYLKTKDNILKINKKTKKISTQKNKRYIKIVANPKNNNSLFALDKDGVLYKFDPENNTKLELVKNINNFYTTEESIIYITKNPANFYKIKIDSEELKQITFTPLENINTNSKILVRFDDPVAIINKNKELLLFDYPTENFKKLADNVIDVKISNDYSKMIFRNNHEIFVYYFEASYPRKKAGEINLLGRFSKKIQNASWFDFDSQHIFLTINNKVNILELDGRNKRNSEIIMSNPDKFIYNNYDKNIYFLKNEKLKKLKLFLEKK